MDLRGTAIVFKKEIRDLFRDKKTLITSIIIPLVIFPIMFGLMGRGIDSSTKKVTENLKISVRDEGKSSFYEFIKTVPNINIMDSEDLKKDVQDGKIYLGVIIPADFDKVIADGKSADLRIIYDDASQSSSMAQEMIQSIVDEYSKEIVKSRLASRGMDVSILEPVKVTEEIVAKEKTSFAKIMLSMMLPLLLIIYATSTPIAAAVDLGAGEKERGTLEPLLTTQTSRMNLLFGKFFAITLMGIIGIVSSLAGLGVSMKLTPGLFGGEGGLTIKFGALLLIGLVTILLTMVFASLELAISIYARSFKEAQTYLSPLTIIGMAAAYGTYMLDVKNAGLMMFNIPIVNISLIIKELINGIQNPTHLGITFIWSIVYVALSIMFARYMFTREEVIFRT
ncbi:sodium ABC transporter [Fervidicella metallireducens AeB]|uniref:Sodium ABC transporter n=1 Tax=Fervidicella metallireducens AeB TaxID=1403537 RepID=A0A017RS76_9CLOT|nr:ABC transporter permease [Fervidicella metallireducens]EYE87588.1 sodium ABC transporter [Fervidicella metallireducens AeB]